MVLTKENKSKMCGEITSLIRQGVPACRVVPKTLLLAYQPIVLDHFGETALLIPEEWFVSPGEAVAHARQIIENFECVLTEGN